MPSCELTEERTLFVLSTTASQSAMKMGYGTHRQIAAERTEWFHAEGIEVTRVTEPRRVWRFLPVGDERLQEPALLGNRLGPASAR